MPHFDDISKIKIIVSACLTARKTIQNILKIGPMNSEATCRCCNSLILLVEGVFDGVQPGKAFHAVRTKFQG